MLRQPRLLALLLALGFALRLGYGLARAPQGPAVPNTDGYVDLATSFARDGCLCDEDGKPSTLREPAYPVLLGVFFKACGRSYRTLLVLNCLLGVLSLWLLFSLGRSLYGERVASLALAIAAFYPPFVYYAAQPLRETALAFICLASLWALERADRDGRPLLFAGAGAIAAAAALTKATLLPFGLLLAPLGLLFLGRERPERAGRRALAYVAAFVLVFAAWPLRNWRTSGRFIWGNTEGGGSNFYQYLVVPQDLGGTSAQGDLLSNDPVYQAAGKLDPIARDRALWKGGLDIVRRRPVAYVRLVAWRLFWDSWRPAPRPRSYAYSYGTVRWISLLTDGWIIPLGFIGILLARLSAPRGLWIYLLLFSESFAHALIFTMIRYRFARMPILILYAALALERIVARLRRRGDPSTPRAEAGA